MATDNGWNTPVHETWFTTDIGDQMIRATTRRKTGLVRIYLEFADDSRLGLSVTPERVLAARGTNQEAIVAALDEAERKADLQTAQPMLST